MQMDVRRQVLAQQLDPLRDQRAVISIERSAADALREFGERDTAHLQAVIDDGELGHRRVRDSLIAHRIKNKL